MIIYLYINSQVIKYLQNKKTSASTTTAADHQNPYESFELNSLSQFRYFASIMRDLVWNACAYDENKVFSF